MDSISITDWIKIILTSISFIDFIVFTILFSIYLIVIHYKTTNLKIKIGSFIILLFFILFKTMHLPAFLSTIVIINWQMPYANEILFSLTWINIMLAFLPLLTLIISLYLYKSNPNEDISLFKNDRVNIIMPIYNEDPDALWKSIQSIQNLDYNLSKIHLYLSFDDDKENDALKHIVSKFKISQLDNYKHDLQDNSELKISICKFPHGGKKSAQQGGYNMIKTDYNDLDLANSILFLTDSDIQLKKDSLWQFVRHMKLYNKTCLTGMITCVSSNKNFLSYYQDVEYISGQIFWRNLENLCGSTSCLPGAFTVIKWEVFNNIAYEYFLKKDYSDSFEYQRFYLGEDRYLTHLLMQNEKWKIGFCEKARCKTDAPLNINALLKQRKRWFLGHISNDTWMLSSPSLWYTYPLLTLFNFLNNSRNTSVYIYLLYFVMFFNNNIDSVTWFIYIILPIFLTWTFIIYYAYIIKRKMNILFYICIILFQPIFNMLYMYYTIYDIRVQSWGGVRIDKAHGINRNEMTQIVIT
jgi:cellulose synthase/poly-beta-1,6-N-acetylglucosamine synthase-like glycosyltransferase